MIIFHNYFGEFPAAKSSLSQVHYLKLRDHDIGWDARILLPDQLISQRGRSPMMTGSPFRTSFEKTP
jgi:hypothetical protein